MEEHKEFIAYGVKWFKTINVGEKGRSKDQILREAEKLSKMRESFGDLTKDDGRYCPICHIAANIHKDVKCPICKGPTFRGEF